METVLKAIGDWLKSLLTAGIMSNLSGLFDAVNEQVGDIAQQIGTRPSAFEPRVFAMIESLSRNVVLPIAGIILTFIACYELIEMITQHNNMAQFEPALIMRWVFKTAISVWFISNTFDIVMAVFDLTQKVVADSSGIIAGNTRVNDIGLSMLEASLMQMEVGPLFGLFLQSFFIGITMRILSIVIFVIVYITKRRCFPHEHTHTVENPRSHQMTLDYFYGQSGELFSYFRIPKALFQDHRFRQLSTDARTLYGILLDRMSLSAKNGWLDEQGRVYIIYTVQEVQESLCCAEHKAVKLFRELEGIDLIERKRRDLGRPSLIYVKDFSSGLPKVQVQNCPNSNSGAAESAILVQPKPQANKTDAENVTGHRGGRGLGPDHLRLDEIEAGVCAPARFHPKENCIFLALLCSYPFARYHKTRIEKADWKQKHFQSAYLFVRQISFQLMPGLPQLKGRCTLPPFHKAHHLPTLPTRV